MNVLSTTGTGRVHEPAPGDVPAPLCKPDSPKAYALTDRAADCKLCARVRAGIAERVAEFREDIARLRELRASDSGAADELAVRLTEELSTVPAAERPALVAEIAAANSTERSEVVDQAGELVESKNYEMISGVPELVAMGAERVAEGVQGRHQVVITAEDVAKILLDMRLRMVNADGLPDLTGRTYAAKQAASAMYKAAGESIRISDEYDAEKAIRSTMRAVQRKVSDVRAEFLRGLDHSKEDAARFARVIAAAPKGKSASEAVADAYGVSLKGDTELARERWRAKNSGEPLAIEPVSADDRLAQAVTSVTRSFRTAKPADFVNASEDAKAAALADLVKARKDLSALIKALA